MKVITLLQSLKAVVYGHACLLAAKPTMNPNPFSYVSNSKITSNKAIKGTGASWYELMQTFSIIGMVISIFIVGIMFAFVRNSEKRREVKKQITVKLGIFTLICAFAWLFGEALKIADSLT